MVRKGKSIALVLSADEVMVGEAGQLIYNNFCEQVSALKAATIWMPELVQQDTMSVATGIVTRKKLVMEANELVGSGLHYLPVHREKANASRASAVSISTAGSICHMVLSPILYSGAKDVSSNGESEAAADPTPCHICPHPTHQTNNEKEHVINVDESKDEKLKLQMVNDELHYGLCIVQGKLLKMYEMAYDLVDELKKIKANLVDHI
ncbi:hypothetical protein DFH29DRAFT_875783 [Suillus ampliporus]|nr:hypothetical protein DFH29DRAFT_875783 [Suillus ampliporus]